MLSVREAFQALSGNKLQVFLATVGVAVGVGSMVFLVAIVAGVHRFALEQTRLEGLGLITIALQPPRGSLTPGRPPVRLNASDAEVASMVQAVGRTSPRRTLNGYTLRLGQEQTTSPVAAVNEAYLDIHRLKIDTGRGLTTYDLSSSRRTIVLGAGAARALFDDADPLGKTVLLNEWPFDVVGVLAWQVEPAEPDRYSYLDSHAYIPYTTAHETFVQPEQADSISVEIADARAHEQVALAVRAHVSQAKGLTGNQRAWLRVYDSVERTQEMNKIMLALKALVGLVGSISLFVGAVGVMNIMIVSVTQRTSEIGLRRAVGARASLIRRQFLFESLVVTALGGVTGLIGAIMLTWAIQLVPRVEIPKPHVSLATAGIAVGIILLTGIVAGVAPAIRASRISPTEALRHE